MMDVILVLRTRLGFLDYLGFMSYNEDLREQIIRFRNGEGKSWIIRN